MKGDPMRKRTKRTTIQAVYYSIYEAAKLMNVQPRQLQRLISSGRLLVDIALDIAVHPLKGDYYISSRSLSDLKRRLHRRS